MKTLLKSMVALAFMAQAVSAGYLGLFGAYWDPEDADSEIGFGAKLAFPLSPEFTLQFRGKYFEFEQEGIGGPGTRATLEVIPIQAALIYNFQSDSPVRPYIGGGVGYYLFDLEWADQQQVLQPDVDDEVGYFALGGLRFEINPQFSLFAEASYTWVQIKRIAGFRTTGDDTLDGVGFNAGLTLHW